MIDTLLERLSAAEHHGGGRTHTKAVGSAMHVHPFVDAAFEAADPVPDGIIENLGAAAGNGIETGVAETGDRVAQRETAHIGNIRHFGSRETVEMNGEALFDAAEQVFIPLDLQVGM